MAVIPLIDSFQKFRIGQPPDPTHKNPPPFFFLPLYSRSPEQFDSTKSTFFILIPDSSDGCYVYDPKVKFTSFCLGDFTLWKIIIS